MGWGWDTFSIKIEEENFIFLAVMFQMIILFMFYLILPHVAPPWSLSPHRRHVSSSAASPIYGCLYIARPPLKWTTRDLPAARWGLCGLNLLWRSLVVFLHKRKSHNCHLSLKHHIIIGELFKPN